MSKQKSGTAALGGKTITLRAFEPADAEAILAFAGKMPLHDLLFLSRDIRHPRVVSAWLDQIAGGQIISTLAIDSTSDSRGGIVGCTALVRVEGVRGKPPSAALAEDWFGALVRHRLFKEGVHWLDGRLAAMATGSGAPLPVPRVLEVMTPALILYGQVRPTWGLLCACTSRRCLGNTQAGLTAALLGRTGTFGGPGAHAATHSIAPTRFRPPCLLTACFCSFTGAWKASSAPTSLQWCQCARTMLARSCSSCRWATPLTTASWPRRSSGLPQAGA